MEEQIFNEGSLYFSTDLFEYLFDENGDEKTDKPEYIESAIFREGSFKHRWYGDIDFDEAYLDAIIKNFNDNINPQAISVNLDHRPSGGAFGWVPQETGALFKKRLSFNTPMGPVSKTFLMARWEPTDEAWDLIKQKKYRYFSAEVAPNFTTREYMEVPTNGGDRKDKTVMEYGPALTGFALTNNPFIPNLPGLFSETSGISGSIDMQSDLSREDGVAGFFCSVYKEEKADDIENEAEVITFNTKPVSEVAEEVKTKTENVEKGESGMNFSEFLAGLNKFSDPKEKLDWIREHIVELSEGDSVSAEYLLNSVQKEYDAHKRAEDAVRREKLALSQVDSISKEKMKLEDALVEAKQLSFSNRVKAFCGQLSSDGFTPAVVNKVEQVFNSLKTEAREMKFNMDGEGGEQEVDLFSIVEQILATVPSSGRLDTTENLEANQEFRQVDPDANAENVPTDAPVEDEAPAQEKVPAHILKYSKRMGLGDKLPEKRIWPAIKEDGNIDLVKFAEIEKENE